METGKIKQLLQRYLSGHTSQKETVTVDEWYQSFDNEALPELSAAEEQQLRQDIWRRISPQIAITKSFYHRAWVRAAAAVILIAGATLGILVVKTGHYGAPAYTEIRTGNRERKTVKMEDGTLLTLNAGSTIRIAKELSRERRVDLVDGEVFFNVGPDTRRPFIVESGPLTTTVLGTSFNISAYRAIPLVNIAVASGRISVTGKGTSGVLQPGQAVSYDKDHATASITTIAAALPEWMQGRLVLNDVPFDQMAVLVEKNFGVRITAEQEKIRNSRYTTVLNTNMDPAAAVEVLAAIHQLKTRTANNHIILYE